MTESWLNQMMRTLMQAQTSDAVIKRELIRQVIYKEAAWLSLAHEAVPTQEFDGIDVKFSYPTEMTGQYPVAEDAKAEISAPMEAVDFEMTLMQGEVRYYITDYAKLRQLGNYQTEFSRRRAAEKLAELKDRNILTALYGANGANSGNDVDASSKKWDAYPTTTAAEIAGHITTAIGNIMANSNVQVQELRSLILLVPAEAYGSLLAPAEIENIRQSLTSYFGQQYGLKIFPTRCPVDTTYDWHLDAMLYVNSVNTLIHGVLRTGATVPLVEEKRVEGRGNEYLIRQFFNTRAVPHSVSVLSTYRAARIKDVRA